MLAMALMDKVLVGSASLMAFLAERGSLYLMPLVGARPLGVVAWPSWPKGFKARQFADESLSLLCRCMLDDIALLVPEHGPASIQLAT